MLKRPSRIEFKAQVLDRWPGATVFTSSLGLYAVVGSADVAMAIELEALSAGYTRVGIDRRGPEDYLVRILGCPKR